MIVRKKVAISLKTGEIISEEVLGPVKMTRDEYWVPFIRIMGSDIIEAALKDALGT